MKRCGYCNTEFARGPRQPMGSWLQQLYCTERCYSRAQYERRPKLIRRWQYRRQRFVSCAALLDAVRPGWRERAAASRGNQSRNKEAPNGNGAAAVQADRG